MVGGIQSKVRWGKNAPSNDYEARERLLDAAQSCFSKFGVGKTTIGDVAKTAKVTRPTVYKYFQNRYDLVWGVLMRDAERLTSSISTHLESYEDVGDAIVEGILFCLRTLPEEPNFQYLFNPDMAGVTSSVLLSGSDFLNMTKALLKPLLEPAKKQGRLRNDLDPDDVTEWVFRIMLSFISVESNPSRGEPEMRRLLRNMLLPSILKDFHP